MCRVGQTSIRSRPACGRHLAGFARDIGLSPELARAVGEILLASVRQPRVATELVATAQDPPTSRGTRLPLIVVFGARGTTLLARPEGGPDLRGLRDVPCPRRA